LLFSLGNRTKLLNGTSAIRALLLPVKDDIDQFVGGILHAILLFFAMEVVTSSTRDTSSGAAAEDDPPPWLPPWR